VDNWIQTCEDNIVSPSSRVDVPKKTFWTLKMRTLLCLKISGSECPLMQYHIPEVQNPQVHCYRSLKLVCTELAEGYSSLNSEIASDQPVNYRTSYC